MEEGAGSACLARNRLCRQLTAAAEEWRAACASCPSAAARSAAARATHACSSLARSAVASCAADATTAAAACHGVGAQASPSGGLPRWGARAKGFALTLRVNSNPKHRSEGRSQRKRQPA